MVVPQIGTALPSIGVHPLLRGGASALSPFLEGTPFFLSPLDGTAGIIPATLYRDTTTVVIEIVNPQCPYLSGRSDDIIFMKSSTLNISTSPNYLLGTKKNRRERELDTQHHVLSYDSSMGVTIKHKHAYFQS